MVTRKSGFAGSTSRPSRRSKAPKGTVAMSLAAELELASEIQKGLPTSAIDEAIDSGVLTPHEVYELVIPRRTLAHRKENQQLLTSDQSDRLARVLRVFARAEQALGEAERASQWLRKPNRALNGHRPIDLLASDAGARAVERILGRVEHGVYS